MKFITQFTIRPGCWPQVAERFLKGDGQPPAGVTLLGRWHNADHSGGFTLVETNDAAAAYEFAAQWSDIIEQRAYLVVEDAEAGAGLTKRYAK